MNRRPWIYGSLFLYLTFSTQILYAADTACAVTVSNAGLVDARSFPTSAGDTVLNGRSDANPSTCYIASNLTPSTVYYPNGLLINSGGTGLTFFNIDTRIYNGLTVDDGGSGAGLVTFMAGKHTSISGPVLLTNDATVKFDVYNNESSTSRLYLNDAYFTIDAGSELQAELKLGDTTGSYLSVGALQGTGNVQLLNVGKTTGHGTIYISNGDGLDYSFAGDIYYSDQSTPSLSKQGLGTFTFTGDVKKSSGDSIGFTDGFDLIEVTGGALETTTEAFVYGTRVELAGGDLILNQNFNGEISNTPFTGANALYKRGSGVVTLGGIGNEFRGDILIDSGTLGLSRGASLYNAREIVIPNGSILDISQVYSATRLSRVTGAGTIALGSKDISQVISVSPGDSIGVLNVTGTGNLNLGGTLINIQLDPTQGAGDIAGTTHDQLQIDGTVTIAPTPLIQLFDVQNGGSPTEFLNGREFTVVTAASGLSGLSPQSIIEDTRSFHAFVGADPSTAVITDTSVVVKFGIKSVNQVTQSVINTGTTGSSNNSGNATQQYLQQTTGLTGNQVPTQTQLLTNPALQNLTTHNLARASSNNNPEAYSSNLTLGLEYADFVGNTVMDHASGAGLGLKLLDSTYNRDGRFWMDVSYSDGEVEGDSDQTGDFDYNLSSIVFGTDLIDSELNTMGLFASFGQAEMDEHDHIDQTFEADIVHAGAYHQHRFNDGYTLSSMGAVFYADYDSERQNFDTNGGYGPKSEAEFASYGATLGLKGAKQFILNPNFSVTPSVGVTYTYLTQEEIDEQGGGAAYDYEIDDADAQAIVLGLGVDTSYRLTEELPVILDFRVRYEYDVYADSNQTHDIKAGLDGQPKHTFIGQNRGEHGVSLGVGLGAELTDNMVLGGGYLYSKHTEGNESRIGAHFTYRW